MHNTAFRANTKVYCLWGEDLQKQNLDFIRGIDHRYFAYVAEIHSRELDGADRQRAAIALRAAYHHGVETLFTLLGAALQGPQCVPAWILRCDHDQVRRLVQAVQQGGRVRNLLHLSPVSWEGIAGKLFITDDSETRTKLAQLYPKLWSELAEDFLSPANLAEYNTLKHGFRMRPQGLTFKVGETGPGGSPPRDNEWKILCDDEFGTASYVARSIEKSPQSKDDPHLQLVTRHMMWDPHAMARSLVLISLSLQNIAAGLLGRAGEHGDDTRLFCPVDESVFSAPVSTKSSLRVVEQGRRVCEAQISRFSAKEIGRMLKTWEQPRPRNS